MLAGIPFGFGFCIIFTAFLNYLTDAYEIYAASAMAATSMCRSMLGAAFPLFASNSMVPLQSDTLWWKLMCYLQCIKS